MMYLKLLQINENDNVDTYVYKYETLLSSLLDKCAPSKKRRILVRPNTPWFSDQIRKAKCHRRELEHRWRRTKLEVDRQAYGEQRQKVKAMTEMAKLVYYSDSVKKCNGDQKALFKVVNNLMHKSKEPVLPSCSSD
jgi:hypothetical protein